MNENLGETKINYGFSTNVTMIIANNEVVKIHEINWSDSTTITLNEIYEKLNTDGLIFVWEETALSGVIYSCNNYEKGLWTFHGRTNGYA